MNRLLMAAATTAAACAVAVPAFAGLSGNPSFSHRLPVRIPSHAQLVQFDDHGRAVDDLTDEPSASAPDRSSGAPGPSRNGSPGRSAGDSPGESPGDRHGDPTRVEPGDDHNRRGRSSGAPVTPAHSAPAGSSDDHGGGGSGGDDDGGSGGGDDGGSGHR